LRQQGTRNAKPGTVNRELAVLSHLFNQAIEWGWIDKRPAKSSALKKTPAVLYI